ncbi:hypothetical protein KTH_35560 [Thermosporothrix hazakensis]|uniref:Uncharacterized protein n=1 Tax=Thermosporothrix sp. COM3 TaxID=2490863 RepID=A0A455SSP9_9CHLR|nr:hypothetical protein KTC_53870 [Thermosporothrix sp. COM3]GCE48687.1 hypothetical protein KTH_35560 [Thermosporothrix hazakensis]
MGSEQNDFAGKDQERVWMVGVGTKNIHAFLRWDRRLSIVTVTGT